MNNTLKTLVLFGLAIILIVAGFRGVFGSALAALIVPQNMRVIGNANLPGTLSAS